MSLTQMISISHLDGIVNQDRTNHLHCRKQQILAFVASRCDQADLLLHGALGSTFDIYRHCYVRHEYRWAFPTPYVVDDDLRSLGFVPHHLGKVELPDVAAGLVDLLGRGQPVFFYAPRGDFAYWVEFMRRTGTIPAEYRNLHSFLVCGIDPAAEQILVVDNTTDNHDFQPFVIPTQVLAEGYAREPERWFTDCLTLEPAGEPDLAAFARRYRSFVTGFRDGFEIYDLIAEGLAGERAAYPDTYRAPSVNSLALLAGSREMFCRFLRHTGHDRQVRSRYEQIAALTTLMLERVGRYHARGDEVPLDGLRRDLHALRIREQRAAVLLRDDLAEGGVSFPAWGWAE